MSGFAGLLRHDGGPVGHHDLDRLARALPHFDGNRASIWNGGSAGLVHRLYAISPEDRLERQPWASRDGSRRLVFAGRLDNREELAAQLGLSPAALRETSDGALCLAAIEKWGDEAPAHLFGGFAFACWNEQNRRLLLCRDPMGGRALYFHRAAAFTTFATTMTALHALPDVPRALDETIVGDLLANNIFETRRTIYRGIERILSGELASCDRAGMTMRRFWQPRRRSLGLNSHDDYVEAAREQLDRAVARAMRSAGPIAAHASGGLDSSGVAATAARLAAPGRLAVYTRVPPAAFDRRETDRKYFSERPKVTALARMHPNMDVTFVDDAGLHAFDLEPSRAFSGLGFPIIGVNNFGWFFQLNDRVAAAGHRVLLTGQCGNFSLGWPGHHLLHRLVAERRWRRAAKEVFALRHVIGQSIGATLRQFILGPREPAVLRKARRWWQGVGAGHERHTFLAQDFANEHRLVERIQEIGGWSDEVRWQGDAFHERSYWLINARELSHDFNAQMLAISGFEMRDPLGDPRLIEFCLNVPEEHYLREGRPRALQRDTLADRVPPEIFANFKHGEQTPEWFDRLTARRDAIVSDIESIARSPLASRAIDVDGLRAAAKHWPADAGGSDAAGYKFRLGLPRAVHIGNFIRWFEGGNR